MRRDAFIAGLGVLLAVSELTAQDAQPPVLHEFFVLEGDELRGGPPDSSNSALAQPVYSYDGPRHPTGDRPDRPGARNAPEPGFDHMRLDRDTDLEGWLTYYAAFDPTVAPFKRGGARDRLTTLNGDIQLVVGGPELEPVRLSDGDPQADTEVFWGSVLVELQQGLVVPIPSVAPEMAIHRVATDPPVQLRFYRDGADNYLVGGDHAGVVRVDFQVSASTAYFFGPLPVEGRLNDIPTAMQPQAPQTVLAPAQEVFEMLGLSADTPVSDIVSALAGYFRAFRAEPFPPDEWSEDIYRDILFGGRGVCRHRAFAFVVTLQAWGIPARYVYNEAHAFTEVYLPNNGWRRVDLGGGALGLHVLNAASRVMHASPDADLFPSPAEYQQNYSERVREQLSRREIEEGDGTADEADPGDPIEMDPWDPFDEYSVELAEASDERSDERLVDESDPSSSRLPTADRRRPTTLSLSVVERDVYRGQTLQLQGSLRSDDGQGVAGRPVRVFLAPSGNQWAERVIEVGTLVSDADGHVAGALPMPHSLPLGVWDVYLVFAGDPDLAPSRAR